MSCRRSIMFREDNQPREASWGWKGGGRAPQQASGAVDTGAQPKAPREEGPPRVPTQEGDYITLTLLNNETDFCPLGLEVWWLRRTWEKLSGRGGGQFPCTSSLSRQTKTQSNRVRHGPVTVPTTQAFKDKTPGRLWIWRGGGDGGCW